MNKDEKNVPVSSSSSSQQSNIYDSTATINMAPEDMAQAPNPTWEDYLEMEQLDNVPPPPNDEYLYADWTKSLLEIKTPVERHLLTDQNMGKKSNESTQASTNTVTL